VRIANSVGGRAAVEKYLKKNKAVLSRVKVFSTKEKAAMARAAKQVEAA
jgi:hypothetical protein